MLLQSLSYGGEADSTAMLNETKTYISGQWFLSYMNGTDHGEKVNFFTVKRGYINIGVIFNETFSGRITPDISIDQEGDGAGDLELRLKYAFLKWNLPEISFLTKSYFELGLVHLPWLHFEENINNYRVSNYGIFLYIIKIPRWIYRKSIIVQWLCIKRTL